MGYRVLEQLLTLASALIIDKAANLSSPFRYKTSTPSGPKFGFQPIDDQSRLIFPEIIEDRYDRTSTILTSQLQVSNRYEVINEKTRKKVSENY